MSERATCWSLTINNPCDDDEECINLARQKGWDVKGQKEVGEQDGTPHYQLRLKTPQVRFSAVKKQFPRAHIEIARNPIALEAYVTKDETRVGDLKEQSDKYPSLSKFWTLVFQQLNDETKDGIDYSELECGLIRFYKQSRQDMFEKQPLYFLDEATRKLIRNGYHVESIAANPNTRSQWKLYATDLMLRSYDAISSLDNEHTRNANDNSPA